MSRKTIPLDACIRKVSVLRGRAKEEADRQGLKPNDLVIVTTIIGRPPKYKLEKIIGDPVSFLMSRAIEMPKQTPRLPCARGPHDNIKW